MAVDTNFKKLLQKLDKIHKDYPDLRFGAVIQEAVDNIRRGNNINLFDIGSKQLLSALESFDTQTKTKRDKKK